MNIHAEEGNKVKFVGCSDTQSKWGGPYDDHSQLVEGEVYTVTHTEIHSMHTQVYLEGLKGPFNSVCFEDVEE